MTDIQNDHQFDEIIRKTEKPVDRRVHGPGYDRIFDLKNGAVSEKHSKVSLLFGKKDFNYYFVKRKAKPTVISNWRFVWLEGTSEVELEFDGTFQIGVDTASDAERLVGAVGGYESPTLNMYRLIDAHLHKVLTEIYISSTKDGSNVLTEFGDTNGESEKLNKEVSKRIAIDIGTAQNPFPFRIGFKLVSSPILQIQLSQIPSSFEVSDSAVKCSIRTSALLILDNYQKYKASGLEDNESIKRYIKSALEEATQLFLFGKPYYDIVKEFSGTISKNIESHIERVANGIGYEVRMFQSLTDIESMDLLEGMRVDVRAADTEYRTKNSTGHVKVGLSVEMKVLDFNLLKRLIKPGQSGIGSILREEVVKICRDVISSVERRDFNLGFDEKVIPTITTALSKKLKSRYGLDVDVIKIEQEPTEDARRFQALSGNTQYFTLEVKPIADGGKGDIVKIQSAFEIVGMSDNGWNAFENKDYGYRASSDFLTPLQKAELYETVNGKLENPTSEDLDAERRSVAITKELEDISLRIKQVIESKLDKVSQLANAIRQAKNDETVRIKVETWATDAIREEWGLDIKLRAFKRLQGNSEITTQIKSVQAHRLIRNQTKSDMSQQSETKQIVAKGNQEYLESLMDRRKQLLADEDHDPEELKLELEDIDARIEEKTPDAETPMDLEAAESLTSLPELDQSWSSDNPLLELDNSEKKLNESEEI